MKFSAADVEESKAYLRSILTPGTTLRTNLRHVARSGMMRHISVHFVKDGELLDLTWHVARAGGFKLADSNEWAIKMDGCGMDMGFALVYSISRTLYPEGHKCTGSTGYTPTMKRSKAPRCPSNDHSNDFGVFDRKFRAAHAELDADNSQEARTAYCSLRSYAYDAEAGKRYSKRRHHSDGGYAIHQLWL